MRYIYLTSFHSQYVLSHLSCGMANQYSGCFPRLPSVWMGLEGRPAVKDFLMGLPTLKHRNMGGCLLFSSDESSMSAGVRGEEGGWGG